MGYKNVKQEATHRGGIFFFASCSKAIVGALGRVLLKLLVKLLVVFDDRSISLMRFELRLLFSMITFSYPLRTDLKEDAEDVVIFVAGDVVCAVEFAVSASFTSITVTKWLGFASNSLWLLLSSRSTAARLSLTLSFDSIALCSVFGPFSLSAALTLLLTPSFTVTVRLFAVCASLNLRPWMFDESSLMNWLRAPSLLNCTSSVSFLRTTTSPSSSSLEVVLWLLLVVAGVEAALIIWFCVGWKEEKKESLDEFYAELLIFITKHWWGFKPSKYEEKLHIIISRQYH